MPARPRDLPWTREPSPFQTAFDHLPSAQPEAVASAAPAPTEAPLTSRPANDDFDDWSDVMPTCA